MNNKQRRDYNFGDIGGFWGDYGDSASSEEFSPIQLRDKSGRKGQRETTYKNKKLRELIRMGADIKQKPPLLTVESAWDYLQRTKKDQRGYHEEKRDGMAEVFQKCPKTKIETLKHF